MGAYRNFDNIGKALGHDGLSFAPERVRGLKHLVDKKIDSLLEGKLHAAPLNVFVKPEAHKISKIEQGRYRLISGVALEDAMIDRILFGPLARKVMETVGQTPLMVGNSLFGGQWRRLRAKYGTDNLAIDKSGWDWSMQYWLITFFIRLLRKLAPDATPEFWTAVEARLHLLFVAAVFGFQDGTTVQQLFPGIMKSGCYITIILNSLCQLALHYATILDLGLDPAEYGPPDCLGDDTTQRARDLIQRGYVAAMQRFGCLIKEAEVHKHIEFAGFRIYQNKIEPAYQTKHLYRLMYNSNLPEWLEMMQMLYAYHDKMLSVLRKGCLATGNASSIRCRAMGLRMMG